MPQVMGRLRFARLRLLVPLLLVSLLAIASLAVGSEPPPIYEIEWSITPYSSPLSVPLGAALDQTGNLYVTARVENSVMKFTGDGTYLTSWQVGSGGSCFPIPASVDVAPDGSSWIIDFGCRRLLKFDPSHALTTAVSGFLAPAGVALGPDGSVYVADTFNHRIRKFDASGNPLLTWGSFGAGEGQFNTPFDVDVDGAGNVYVLDSYNQRIQVFTSSGAFLRAFGEAGFGADHLIQPAGLGLDPAGANVYVADTGNHQVVKFSAAGERLCAWGGIGSAPGQMIAPNDVAVDAGGHVFVVDSGNRRIQRFGEPLVFDLRVEPRTLNARSGGKWVTAYIEPPSPFAPADIDVASLTLNGVSVDPAAPVDVTDIDGDGRPELSVRFSREAVVATAAAGADRLELHLVGTANGTSFTGADVVRVIGSADISVYDPGLSDASSLLPASPELFELRPPTPNPIRAGADLVLSYRAPGAEPATVDVIDLSGRRVARVQVVEGRGLRSVRVPFGRALTPGLYLVRLVQGARAATAKIAVVQ